MNKTALAKWAQHDVKKRGELIIKRDQDEMVLELEGLDWTTTRNLLKTNTVGLKGGVEKKDDDGFMVDMIAKTVKKMDGEPFDLYDKETLEVIGVKTTEQAINKLFTIGEIGKLITLSRELSGDTDEAEKEEIDELKN